MATFVAADDLQPRSSGEPNRSKRILESDVVYVMIRRALDQIACRHFSGKKPIKDAEFDSRPWHNLFWRARPVRLGRRLDEAADKPARKPSQRDLLYRRRRLACDSIRDRW